MDDASWALVGLWGLAAGVVAAHARGPGGSRLLWAAVAVQAATIVSLVWWSPDGHAGALGIAALGLLAGGFLAGGQVWRESPQLTGVGYWGRCLDAFLNERGLRRAHRELDRRQPAR